jgi:hypothetical protein
MQEIIPAYLMNRWKPNEFCLWLRGQRIDAESKKQLLRLWGDRVGIKITREMVIKAGIERR